MRFVSRERYDAMEAHYQALLSTADRRFDDLLTRYHETKVAVAPPIPAPTAPLTKKPADRVQEVIADVAGNNGPLRAQLGRFARNARFERVPEDEIIHQLLHWPEADADE